MKKLFTTVLALACFACAKDIVEPTAPQQTEISAPATRIIIESDEDQITLGQKLTNPLFVPVGLLIELRGVVITLFDTRGSAC